MLRMLLIFCVRATAVIVAVLVTVPLPLSVAAQAKVSAEGELLEATLARYCVSCHSDRLRTADLSLEGLDLAEVGTHAEVWERVVAKLRTQAMPPVGRPRPDQATYGRLASWLEAEIDRVATVSPDPGRTEAVHRLNRVEYRNAVKDLLAIDVDADELLPADDFDEYGFDNNADVLTVSSSLMERYLSAARKIGRLALGETPLGPTTDTYKVPILLLQDDRMGEDLPFGSRGGIGIRHYFPVDGEYDLEIRLHRNYVNYVRGMGSRHELQVRLDGVLVRSFTFGGEEPDGVQAPASYGGNQFGDPEWEEYMLFADANMRVRFQAQAGPRVVAVSFVRKFTEPEGVLQPRQSVFAVAVNEMRDGNAAVEHVVIGGPYVSAGSGDTPSRRAIFNCQPVSAARVDEEACARTILGSLARRGYRRPVEDGDVDTLMGFYRAGRDGGSFDSGIQLAIERLLIAPDFLFRVVRDPIDALPATAYALSDLDLASRLSFFLWSTGPDDALLELAERGELGNPVVLEQQVRRMLLDPRSQAIVDNFVGQWLLLRNVAALGPDPYKDPDFDESLRKALRRETELLFESIIRKDRSVIDLLEADYTFVNERLAEHYDIPFVKGDHFRRVALRPGSVRGGLLGQGSILSVTSQPDRTSPVLRGKWILENILGVSPPAPPPDVPDLAEQEGVATAVTMRERMEAHRANPVCASCHRMMDPLGLALEHFDQAGRWRTVEESFDSRSASFAPIDASGAMPDGTQFVGAGGLRKVLLDRSDRFVATMIEKLLTYALGRGLEPYDMPAVRAVAREAASDGHRLSSIIVGVVRSIPFQMRRSES
mgnify:CR=1 FL=1